MKRCPECRRDYYDDTLSFCLEDGTPLVYGSVQVGSSGDEPATAILSVPPAVASEVYVRPSTLAVVYIGLGGKEEALNQLEKDAEGRSESAGYFAVLPELDELRAEPRFKVLLKRMNLPE